jgi:hypothetical protein
MPITPTPVQRPPDFWTVYGHSYFQYNFGTRSQAGRADSAVRSALDIEFNNWVNHSTNGARLVNDGLAQGGFGRVLQNITGSQLRAPYVSQGGAYLFCWGINDLGGHGDTAQIRLAWQYALRTVISRARMSTLREDSYSGAAGTGVIAYGAGFVNSGFTWDYTSGTSFRQATSTTNATVTITLPTDYTGAPIMLLFTAFPGNVGGVVTFSGTAGVTGTLDVSDIMPGATLTRSPVPKRITNLTSANAGQTIIATVTSLDGGGQVNFDCYWIESETPPPVLVCNINKMNSAGWDIYALLAANSDAVNNAFVDTWNAATQSVVAEFDSMVQIVDIDAALDAVNLGAHAKTPTLAFDGLHPTEFGAARIADEVIRSVGRLRPTTLVGHTAHFNPQSARSAPITQPYRDGFWYTSEAPASTAGTAYTAVAQDVWSIPFWVSGGQMQVTQWSMEKVANNTVAPTVFMVIHDDRQLRGYPQYMHAQPANSTALSLGIGAGIFTSTLTPGNNGYILQPLDPGLYWLTVKIVVPGTATTFRSLSGQSRWLPSLSNSGGGNVISNGYKLTGQGTGAFSGLFTQGAVQTNFAPYIGLKMQNLGQL